MDLNSVSQLAQIFGAIAVVVAIVFGVAQGKTASDSSRSGRGTSPFAQRLDVLVHPPVDAVIRL